MAVFTDVNWSTGANPLIAFISGANALVNYNLGLGILVFIVMTLFLTIKNGIQGMVVASFVGAIVSAFLVFMGLLSTEVLVIMICIFVIALLILMGRKGTGAY